MNKVLIIIIGAIVIVLFYKSLQTNPEHFDAIYISKEKLFENKYMDSIVVDCNAFWQNNQIVFFSISVSANSFTIWQRYPYESGQKFIFSVKDKQSIMKYIDMFYISKTEKYYNRREKRENLVFMEYSSIVVTGFYNNQECYSDIILVGEPEYTIILNPKFEQFYKLLKSIFNNYL